MLIRVFIHGKKWVTHLVRLSPISSIAPIEILLCIYERIELHPTNIFQSHRAHIMVVWRILVIPPPLSPSDCPCFPSPPHQVRIPLCGGVMSVLFARLNHLPLTTQALMLPGVGPALYIPTSVYCTPVSIKGQEQNTLTTACHMYTVKKSNKSK